ncbi:Serine/threonine-protein kinase [Nowakowskiella sp. JEL0407]|nr:Serine/threonine-protein kinase [Nowakowskiella sp. JEL0407]
MGNIQSANATTTNVRIDSYVGELSNVQYERSLGSARFMKTIRCRQKDGIIVVKIFVKPDTRISLKAYAKSLRAERDILFDIPNTLPYQRIIETERAGYLIRQHIFSSLYDRISTRPFLNLGEKKWIAFQLMKAVSAAHERSIYHGDIKTENVFVTSWNWVFLSDFSSFKPTFLPEDNPADFSFYFDTSSRRTCYLAPERFYSPGETLFNSKNGSVEASMDIFSLGCTLAELFLEGTSLFTLAQLLRYRSNQYDPTAELKKIECPHISQMIQHMIQLDPNMRYSAYQYLTEWRGTGFPDIFYGFLHEYVAALSDPSKQSKTKFEFPVSSPTQDLILEQSFSPSDEESGFVSYLSPDADTKIRRIYFDFCNIALSSGILLPDTSPSIVDISNAGAKVNNVKKFGKSLTSYQSAFPVCLNIPGYQCVFTDIDVVSEARDVCLIFITIICACIRNTSYPSSRLFGIELILAFSVHLSDESRLDRCIPYLLLSVESITPIDSNIFPEYILPCLRRFSSDPDAHVRATYAECIATIAETALRFLELSEIWKNNTPIDLDSDLEPTRMTYDLALRELHETIQEDVATLLIDSETSVKRFLLVDMARLCIFFGRQRTNDVLLSHMITYLNDPDWQLRAAFFDSIVGVAMFVGSRSLEEYILPLIMQSLTDSEEFVVEKVLHALTALTDLGLLLKPKLKELAAIVIPLACHPNLRIRYRTISFIGSIAKRLPLIDVRCILYPTIRPFLKTDIFEITETSLMEYLKERINRGMYDKTLALASKNSNTGKLPEFRQISSSGSNEENIVVLGKRTEPQYKLSPSNVGSPSTSSLGGESDLLLQLREMGMSEEDKEKLMAMKEYIYKSTQSRMRKPSEVNLWSNVEENKSGFVNLKYFGVIPHTVFLSPNDDISDIVSQSRIPVVLSSMSLGEISDQSLSPARRDSRASFDKSPRLPSLTQFRQQSSTYFGNAIGSSPEIEFERNNIPVLRTSSASGLIPIPGSSTPRSKLATTSTSSESVTARLEVFGSSANSNNSGTRTEDGSPQPIRAKHRPSLSTELDSDFSPFKMSSQLSISQISTSPQVYKENPALSKSPNNKLSNKADEDDKFLKKLFAKKTIELFPPPIADLGPRVNPPTATTPLPQVRRNRTYVSSETVSSPVGDLKNWKPQGLLVSQLSEHASVINKVSVAPDHSFFASCSNDGTVRIWDTRRLEKNVTNRSRLVYAEQGGKITSIAFCENTRSIVSASSNGTIHVGRVEYSSPTANAPKFNFENIRKLNLDDGDYPVLLEHFDTESESIIMYATAYGKVCGFDLRTMKSCWEFKSNNPNGIPTAILSEPKRHNYIVSGTHRGVFSLLDVRFQLPVKVWTHPSKSRINAIVPSWTNAHGRSVMAAVNGRTNEVSLWDVESSVCKEVWCVVGSAGSAHIDPEEDMKKTYGNGLKALPPPDLSDIESALQKYDENIIPQNNSSPKAGSASNTKKSLFNHGIPDSSVRAIINQPDMPYFLTAGSDRKIRYWDTSTIANSYIVYRSEVDKLAPRYASHSYGDVVFNLEYTPHHGYASTSSKSPYSTGRSRSQKGNTESDPNVLQNHKGTSSNLISVANSAGGVVSPPGISHVDAITDAAVIQVPYPMIITGGRDGVISVHR